MATQKNKLTTTQDRTSGKNVTSAANHKMRETVVGSLGNKTRQTTQGGKRK